MKHSESIKEIAAAIAKAQGAVLGARKDSDNPFFKSKYADLASVVDAIRESFAENGIGYVQSLLTNDKDECGVETMLMHSSGEWALSEPFFLPVSKQDAQGFGSAATYCRRYSLAAMCGVAQVDDDGNAAAAAKPDAASRIANGSGNATQTARDVFNSMSAEEQDFIRTHAAEIKKLYPLGDVFGYLEQQRLDNDEKLALWSQLPSDIRSALKKAQQERVAA